MNEEQFARLERYLWALAAGGAFLGSALGTYAVLAFLLHACR